LVKDYSKQPDSKLLELPSVKESLENSKKAGELIKASIPGIVEAKVEETLKIEKLASAKGRAFQYRRPRLFNTRFRPDRKPGSQIPFSYMRQMATVYPIARACINRRITQITQLEWTITTVDEEKDEKGHESDIKKVTNWLNKPMGHKTRFREMMNTIIDDLLTIDATCFEYHKKRGGEFIDLVSVDPTTIVLRVTEHGATPEPPDIAYAQFIEGRKQAEFTTDELLYDMMRTRSLTPYGLAPIESLIIQTESAIRGSLYNLNHFREGNVPAGFINLSEELAATKDQVEEWQMWFDSVLAGDLRGVHRLKILPGDSKYTPTQKLEDMAFERFEMWLLQQTCAVFDVPPRDIGITLTVNKASDESQQKLSREKGLLPLAHFVKELLDEIIHTQMDLPQLQFEWTNLNPVDRKEEIEIQEREIKLGKLSVDEARINDGLEPIGLGHYLMTKSGPILVKDFLAGEVEDEGNEKEQGKKEEKEEEEKEKAMMTDLRKWRNCLYKDLRDGNPLRISNFFSRNISKEVKRQIRDSLEGISTTHQVKLIFDRYLDQDMKASYKLLALASKMRNIEDAEFE